MTVAVPTLAIDDALEDCLRSLDAQTWEDFEVVVVDNSGSQRVASDRSRVRVISNPRNAGFGAAVNQAFRGSQATYLATLNDDAVADPGWLEALVAEAKAHPDAGMFASQVRLSGVRVSGSVRLDSAGMLIAADGSSRQRGHRRPPGEFADARDALFPSGSAAMYRRAMLDQVGGFEDSFFLYCEDTDLGLRARWAGWSCRYVPEAVVDHRYSHSAGRASPLKAYYVERNRLYVVLRNFPLSMLWRVPFYSGLRYGWHLASLFTGEGIAGEYRGAGHPMLLLPLLVARAHIAAILHLPGLLAARRRIRKTRRLSVREFRDLLGEHWIEPRQVAAL